MENKNKVDGSVKSQARLSFKAMVLLINWLVLFVYPLTHTTRPTQSMHPTDRVHSITCTRTFSSTYYCWYSEILSWITFLSIVKGKLASSAHALWALRFLPCTPCCLQHFLLDILLITVCCFLKIISLFRTVPDLQKIYKNSTESTYIQHLLFSIN